MTLNGTTLVVTYDAVGPVEHLQTSLARTASKTKQTIDFNNFANQKFSVLTLTEATNVSVTAAALDYDPVISEVNAVLSAVANNNNNFPYKVVVGTAGSLITLEAKSVGSNTTAMTLTAPVVNGVVEQISIHDAGTTNHAHKDNGSGITVGSGGLTINTTQATNEPTISAVRLYESPDEGVQMTVTGTTTTINHTNHGLAQGDYVTIEGAAEPVNNGTFQIANVLTDSFTVAAT